MSVKSYFQKIIKLSTLLPDKAVEVDQPEAEVLTDQEVSKIWRAVRHGYTCSTWALAKRFGVSKTKIKEVLKEGMKRVAELSKEH